MGIGMRIRKRVTEFIFGLKEINTTELGKIIGEMDSESTIGPTEISILETGKMIKDIITVPFKSYH